MRINWMEWISFAAFVKSWLPIILSLAAFVVTFHDRKKKLVVRQRKHGEYNPYKITRTAGGELAFLGGIEVCNLSARSNAVRDYRFWYENSGTWTPMQSQNYKESDPQDKTFIVRNPTPVAVPPYSGTEVRVIAFTPMKDLPRKLRVRVEIEDLFGKAYRVEVLAAKN